MKRWEDLGNNRWKLTLTDDEAPGTVISVFRGTREEINEKLADSQISASRRIAQLRPHNGNGKANGGAPAAASSPPLTAAERMQTVADLANPATVDKAITRIVEREVGPLAELRQDRDEDRADRQTRAATEAARKFADTTPEWYPSEYNKTTLVRYMQTQGLDPLQEASYIQAFEDLSAAELLQLKPSAAQPSTDETTTEGRNAPTPMQPPTPTRFSTSIRQSDISGSPPRPTTRLKYTREQLANMNAAAYRRLLESDPELIRCVDYYAQQDARKRKAVAS
jgi:hypothetical protein